MSAESVAAPTPASPGTRREPSDWLSPILVKELRQGVRGHVFTGAFLLLHALMLFAMGIALVERGETGMRGASTAFFWFLITIPVIAILPASGGVALSGERAQRTLEPMLLTGLSARRIVFGKWISITTQAAVLLVSVLPYTLLRYFLGGVNLTEELAGLADVFGCSVMLAAIFVGLSPAPLSPLFRWLLSVAVGGFFGFLFQVLFASAVLGTRLRPDAALAGAAIALLLLTIVAALEAGTLQVAPPAETRPGLVRAAALLALVAANLRLPASPSDVGPALHLWALPLAAAVVVGSLCERRQDLPSLYAPLLGRGPGRFAVGVLFGPGWPSGVFFALVAVALVFVLPNRLPMGGSLVRDVIGLAGALLLPVAVREWLFPRTRRTLVWYLLLQVLALGTAALPAAAVLAGSSGVLGDDALLTDFTLAVASLSPLSYLLVRDHVPLAPAFVEWMFYAVSAAAILGALVKAVLALRSLRALARSHTAAARADGTA